MTNLTSIRFLVFFLAASALSVHAQDPQNNTAQATKSPLLSVYKSPTCGCCGKWITHLEKNGFTTTAQHPSRLTAFKIERGISPQYHSCHTAISKQGFVFEGHIPAKYIQKFLAEKPAQAIGLAVPAMPVGSPGMEMGGQFRPYEVLLLKEDGSSEVYAAIHNASQQY